MLGATCGELGVTGLGAQEAELGAQAAREVGVRRGMILNSTGNLGDGRVLDGA